MNSIYDLPNLSGEEWLNAKELEEKLNSSLKGLDLSGLPIRTRSKVVKKEVCRALGYTPPAFFRKTQPRFPVQNLDVYTQKSNNLQIWNEELSPDRRYALIRVDENSIVKCVRVVTGKELEKFDTTGTLTQKYQAKYTGTVKESRLLSDDTEQLKKLIASRTTKTFCLSPVEPPQAGKMLSISAVYEALLNLIGEIIYNDGVDQERRRGAALHTIVCGALGYAKYEDTGEFPDILNQLIEVKLQTSPTIDLGLVSPSSGNLMPGLESLGISHSDVRYAMFYGTVIPKGVQIQYLLLCCGESFFNHFQQFGGLVTNVKIQLPLPKDFFD